MTRRPRRNNSAAFKAKIALAAIQADKTFSPLAEDFEEETFVCRSRQRLWRIAHRRAY